MTPKNKEIAVQPTSQTFRPIKFEFSNPDFLDYNNYQSLPTEVKHTVEMSPWQIAFLSGLIKKFKPKKVLEVGVSAGGGAVALLNALKSLDNESELYSVDVSEYWYKDKSKKVGWVAKLHESNYANWHLSGGKYLPEVITKYNVKFDLCILDSVHSCPGEILDYLVALPYMNMGGIFVFHDTTLYLSQSASNCYATRVLSDCIVGNKFCCLDTTINNLPNIEAVQITEDTIKYSANVIQSLAMKWAYTISDHEFHLYSNFYKEYYGEDAALWFKLSRDWNEMCIRNPSADQGRRKKSYKELMKIFGKQCLKSLLPYGFVNFILKHR